MLEKYFKTDQTAVREENKDDFDEVFRPTQGASETEYTRIENTACKDTEDYDSDTSNLFDLTE